MVSAYECVQSCYPKKVRNSYSCLSSGPYRAFMLNQLAPLEQVIVFSWTGIFVRPSIRISSTCCTHTHTRTHTHTHTQIHHRGRAETHCQTLPETSSKNPSFLRSGSQCAYVIIHGYSCSESPCNATSLAEQSIPHPRNRHLRAGRQHSLLSWPCRAEDTLPRSTVAQTFRSPTINEMK